MCFAQLVGPPPSERLHALLPHRFPLPALLLLLRGCDDGCCSLREGSKEASREKPKTSTRRQRLRAMAMPIKPLDGAF